MDQIHAFKYNHHTGEIYHQGKCIGRLNFSERSIFFTLIQSDLELVERDTLLQVAWPNKIVTSNSLNVAVKNIRSVFLSIGLDDVIVTQVKKGFSWNRYYKVFLTESNVLQSSDANTIKRKDLTDSISLKNIDLFQYNNSININNDESNQNVNPYKLVHSKMEAICKKLNDSSIYFKMISIFMWGGVIAHLFLDSNQNTLDLGGGKYQEMHSCIVCTLSSLTFTNGNIPYADEINMAKFEIKLACDDFISSNYLCINILSESTKKN